MKDFDFDELDRAVSSVLTKQQPTDEPDQPVNRAIADQSAASATTPVAIEPAQTNDATAAVADDDNNHDYEDGHTDEAAPTANHPSEPDHVDEAPAFESQPDSLPDETETIEPEADLPEIPSIDGLDEPVVSIDAEPATSIDAALDQELQSTTDQATSAAVTEDGPHDSESEEVSAPDAWAADPKPAGTPHRRGRFMDMVHPSADMAGHPRPMSSRTGVTLSPTTDFDTPEAAFQMDTPAEDEPETTQAVIDDIDDSTHSQAVTTSSGEYAPGEAPALEPHEFDDAMASEESSVEAGEAEKHDDPSTEPKPEVTTPFIPDVPVEKRPLNSLDSGTVDTPADASQGTTPKEFDAKVMALEADDTVDPAADARSNEVSSPAPSVTAAASAASGTPFIAQQYHAPEEKSDSETHPVFDSSSLQHPSQTGSHHKMSPTVIITIVILLLLVGAALGTLYFLYGQ